MPHWWNETLTLYRRLESKDEDGRRIVAWEREVLKNCFAKKTMTQVYGGGQVIHAQETVFRVPVDQCFIFAEGDIIMIGENPSLEPPMIEGNTFILNEVRDNSKLVNAHFYGRSGGA